MRARRPVLLALLTLAAGAAQAEPPAPAGPFFGLRAGYAIPDGDVARGGPAVEDFAPRKFPLGIELGYRFNRRLWSEVFFEVSPAKAASALCPAGVSCSASDVRLGVGILLRLAPTSWIDPWLGVGAAVEVLNAEGRNVAAGARYEWSWFGFELPYAEAGVDFAVADRVSVGPWISATVARFTSASIRAEGAGTDSGKIDDRAGHSWFAAGLKGILKL
jgi:opacity protein-like surface antigen